MKKILLFSLCLTACQKSLLKEDLAHILQENPEIMTDAIKKNPVEFIEAFRDAAGAAQSALAEKRKKAEDKKRKEYFDKPLRPLIRDDESIRGTKGAPLILVEYSDFECGYCARGFNTVMELMKKYDKKVQFIYKHLPLSFHQNARLASQYYEAIRLQDEKKAFRFHDEIFKQQRKLKRGGPFLKKLALKLKLDMKKLARDIKSKKVAKRIEQDEKEARKFGIQGTPGFILNGIPIKGAHPLESFVSIIEELEKQGKVKL